MYGLNANPDNPSLPTPTLQSMIVAGAGLARHVAMLDDPFTFSPSYATPVMDVNLQGTYRFVQVFAQDMLPPPGAPHDAQPVNGWGGHVLWIGSGAAFVK